MAGLSNFTIMLQTRRGPNLRMGSSGAAEQKQAATRGNVNFEAIRRVSRHMVLRNIGGRGLKCRLQA